MKWGKGKGKKKNGHNAERLIAETRRLREQLTATAARLEVFSGQLQSEVDRLQSLSGPPEEGRQP